MKLFARLHTLILLAFVTAAYFVWTLPSYRPIARAKKAWNRSTSHVVVFGDSWSTFEQVSDTEEKEQGSWFRIRAQSPEKTWVDELCKEMVCDKKLSFAQPFPSLPTHQRGAVVNSDVFANATEFFNFTLKPDGIPDLKAQVDHFLANDVLMPASGQASLGRGQTVFTAFFGLWEIWAFVALADAEAELAIMESVGSLFSELKRLLNSNLARSTRATIIIPTVPDPTWLPRWIVQRTSSADEHGQFQRQAVLLTELWNSLLEAGAQEYKEADIVLPDFNQWMMDLIREPEMAAYEFSGKLFGKYTGGQPTFTDLRQPCVNYTASPQGEPAYLPPPVICADATHHLFWFVQEKALHHLLRLNQKH